MFTPQHKNITYKNLYKRANGNGINVLGLGSIRQFAIKCGQKYGNFDTADLR